MKIFKFYIGFIFYLVISLLGPTSFAQNFYSYFNTSPSCNASGTGEPAGGEIIDYDINTGKPIGINVPAYQYVSAQCCSIYDYDMNCVGLWYDCSYYQFVGYNYSLLPDSDCYTSYCPTTGEYLLFWEPTNLTISGSPSGTYCANESITISAPNVYHSYIWQYSTQTGAWNTIATTPNSSLTLNIQDIFGGDYASHFYEEIFFRYSIEGCSPLSEARSFSFNPIKPEVMTSTQVLPRCKDYADAIINITSISRDILSGETLTYTVYTMSNMFVAQKSSDQQPSPGSPVEVRGDISTVAPFGISSGDYKILIESNLSLCGPVNYYPVPAITNPTPVTIDSNFPVQPLCYGGSNGSITINASGGSGSGYGYSKDNGTNFQSSNVFSGLSFEDYDVVIKDGNSCQSSMTTISVGQPADITLSSPSITSDHNGRDISCVGSTDGEITASATGGTGTLEYSKDGSTFQGSGVFTSLGAGDYTITVRDGNSCTKTSSAVSIAAPPAINGTVTPTATSCNGTTDGMIEVTSASGGTGTLSYSRDGTNFQTTNEFINLAANDYTISIRDANACTTTINATIAQPAALGVTGVPTVITCSGGGDGSVVINATNAVGTPTYSLNGGVFQASNNFTGLTANTYSLAVKDGNGCTGAGSVTVTSNPIITGTLTSTAISCNGGTNGGLNLTSGGGVGPYTFSWSNGQTTEDIGTLAAGTYTVTITDSKLCQQSFNRVLTQPAPITVGTIVSDYNGTSVSCFGNNNGSINITPTGGNGGYMYNWSNGATTQNINMLTAGTYTVTVTDSKSCTGNQSVILTQPQQLTTTISAQNVACFGGNTGSIALSTTGGTTNYEYSIDGGANWQSSPSFTGLTATAYTILTPNLARKLLPCLTETE